jgi:hypothetical protein
MRQVFGLALRVLLALVLCRMVAGAAMAEDNRRTWRTLVFGGADAGSAGNAFVYLGLVHAPFGDLDRSGARLRVYGGLGHYRHVASGTPIRGRVSEGEAMIGWQHVADAASIALYVGAAFRDHAYSRPDPANPVAGTHVGLRSMVEISVAPAPLWHAYAKIAATIGDPAWSAYAKVTRRIPQTAPPLGLFTFSSIEIGVEAAASGDASHDLWKAGLVLGGLRAGPVTFGFSGGYLRNTRSNAYRRDGAYFGMSGWTKF